MFSRVFLLLLLVSVFLVPSIDAGQNRIHSTFSTLYEKIGVRSSETTAPKVKQDYMLLKSLLEGLTSFDKELDKLTARSAGEAVFDPDLDNRIRNSWSKYLRYRKALLLLLTRYKHSFSNLDKLRDHPTLVQKKILIGYASSLFLYSTVVQIVARFKTPGNKFWRKLDEPDSAFNIDADHLSRLHKTIIAKDNVKLLAQARQAYHKAYPEDLLESRSQHWLHKAIREHHQIVDELAPSVWKVRIQQLWRNVKKGIYKPYYRIQAAVSIWLGDTKYVKRKPAIGPERIREMIARLQPGDILLERENWYLSNAFLPGFWPHGILYVGTAEDVEKMGIADDPRVASHIAAYATPDEHGHMRRVIEALSEGVVMSSMQEATDADYICAFRPRVSAAVKREAIARAFSHVGKPYDFDFDFFTSDKLVCTEVLTRAYGDVISFPMKSIMGRMTLPAVNIIDKFAAERGTDKAQLDFVFFLDSNYKTLETWFSDEEALIASNSRPGLTFRLPE